MDIGFRSLMQQSVPVSGLDMQVEFAAGDRLRIEISAKFRLSGIEQELSSAGLKRRDKWTDTQQRFALVLAQPRL
jgi:L-histidine Nalpha-methyltransferase